jgi:arylsulfatase A-like enzyme
MHCSITWSSRSTHAESFEKMKPLPLAIAILGLFSPLQADPGKPNVLFIAIDDLNDWIGCLGGHPQAKTPNIDALAKRGMLFTNAHCNAPVCNPSRVSLMTGIRPSDSGIYTNSDSSSSKTSLVRDSVVIPQHFAANGYDTFGCGKLFHASGGKDKFQTYGPGEGQGPLPEKRINCPEEASKSPLWDWGVFPEKEGDGYHDIADSGWASGKLAEERKKPFFLGCGFYRPHVPFFAPARFFDLHPLESVELPQILENDTSDIPKYALQLTSNPLPPSQKWFIESGEWRHAVQSYLACISFTDDNVGKLVKALDDGPYADNTWIILFSDHGFFLGEKDRWAKQALWERATRVPLVIVPPKNRAGEFAAAGSVCTQPAELLSLFPTLIEGCGLTEGPEELAGHSLMPLLENPEADWPHFAITTYQPDNHAIRDDRYRYIRYKDGSEELYDLRDDKPEWKNLASDPEMKPVIERLSKAIPKTNAAPPKQTGKRKRADEGD